MLIYILLFFWISLVESSLILTTPFQALLFVGWMNDHGSMLYSSTWFDGNWTSFPFPLYFTCSMSIYSLLFVVGVDRNVEFILYNYSIYSTGRAYRVNKVPFLDLANDNSLFNSYQLLSSPAMAPAKGSKRSSKKKGGKAAAAAAPAPPKPETTIDDNAMQTDETEHPSASTSAVQAASELIENLEEVVVDTVEVVKEKVAEVAEAAEEFVEEMDGVEEGASKSGDVASAESATEPIRKMTMDERKAKLAELRKKMVRLGAASPFSTF